MLEIQKRSSNLFLALLSLPATAMGFALSIQISTLSWILSTKYGLEIEEIGLVWAAGPIAGIFGQIIIGFISDNVWFWNGRRRPFIVIGGTFAALMLLALPSIDIISSALGMDGVLGIAITIALLLDLSINVSFNPTRSIIADVTSSHYRTRGYTWMQTISGTFGVLAYAIGALLGKYFLIYLGVGLVFSFSVIPCFFIEEPRWLQTQQEETEGNNRPRQISGKEVMIVLQPLWGLLLFAAYKIPVRLLGVNISGSYFEFLCLALTIAMLVYVYLKGSRKEDNLREFQKILIAHAFTWLGVQSMFVYMFAYIQDQLPSMGHREIGSVIDISFLLLNLVGALLPVIALEPLTRIIGRVRTHMVSIAIMALSYGGIAFIGKSPVLLYVFMILAGVGWGATVSLPFAIMSERIDKSRMGLFMGIFNLSVVLPQLVASLQVGNIVQDATDKSIIFFICAISLGISAILWMFVRESRQQAPEKSLVDGSTTSH
ncbi:MFS transporter [Fulvivirgaceae bacterium BMA12]|uniref:MFS transporter n=1 Tax=Agaribacillus aureus TaxID=3051825 RepID=A0ABT8LG55_9BACT|nr:MFS transporter [Fulvivirgaceae bacterium BMA12]